MFFTVKKFLAVVFVFLSMTACSFAGNGDYVTDAHAAFNRGQADNALQVLDTALQQNTANAAAWNLKCRVYLAQERWNDAISSCQHAVRLEPDSSSYHLWLGRAYGEKASRSSLVSAYKTAKLTHAEFEEAVALDGRNREALSDLGEYYVDAPGFLGGGYDKAESLAGRLDSLDPPRADELRARIAEAKKDYKVAEQGWHAKIVASQSSSEATAQAWMDLGSFYYRRGRLDDMLAALKNGAAADKNHGPALVDGASTLIKSGRDSQLAAQWLREYLNGNALSSTAPAFAVHAELGNLLRKQGDPSAEHEFAAARALSGNYSASAVVSTGD